MALINHATREISAKIVYYGREGIGKHDLLKYIYDRIKPVLRGELKAVSASGDALRTEGRTVTSEVERDADDSAGPIPIETEELLLKPASVQSIAKPEKQAQGEEGRDRLQVAMSGEEDACSEGTVRIPLEITLGGVSRRLVVSIALEPA
jgi:hypothetical protein